MTDNWIKENNYLNDSTTDNDADDETAKTRAAKSLFALFIISAQGFRVGFIDSHCKEAGKQTQFDITKLKVMDVKLH